MFRDLERGHFVALGPALARRPLPIRIGEVATSARSGSFKLLPLPDAPEDARDLIFKAGDAEPARAAPPRRPAMPPPPSTGDILAQLARSRPAPPEAAAELPADERDALLDAILRELLDDPEAAYRSVAVLYQDFQVRCRIRRVPGEALTLQAFRRRLAVARAGVDAGAGHPDWERAVAVSADLEEDLQGVYLLLARAAFAEAPCPPDLDIARACGSRSPGRARRILSYLESRSLVVARQDPRGLRVLALPDLGRETGPGDPNACEAPPAAPGRDLFAV